MSGKIVIAGSRNYHNYQEAKEFIDVCLKNNNASEIIILSGEASGADRLGERYAQEKGYKILSFPAKWNLYGKAAGPKRNEEMAKNADLIICFWDGKSRGTASLIRLAKKHQKPLKIKMI